MQKMKTVVGGRLKSVFVVGSALVAGGASNAFAALDMTAASTAVEAAETSALTMGQTVIGVVAGLIVVALVIAMIHKAR